MHRLVSMTDSHYYSYQLITRKDTLKEKNSGPACDKVRTITKNCKEREQEKEKGWWITYVVSFLRNSVLNYVTLLSGEHEEVLSVFFRLFKDKLSQETILHLIWCSAKNIATKAKRSKFYFEGNCRDILSKSPFASKILKSRNQAVFI